MLKNEVDLAEKGVRIFTAIDKIGVPADQSKCQPRLELCEPCEYEQ